jgi:hypothetical protein
MSDSNPNHDHNEDEDEDKKLMSTEEFSALLEKMVLLNIIKQGKDSKDDTEFYYLTKSFEAHMSQMQQAFGDKAGFEMKMAQLTEQAGSIENAWKSFMMTVIAIYLNLSQDETARRRSELWTYADVLFRIGQFMRFKQG